MPDTLPVWNVRATMGCVVRCGGPVGFQLRGAIGGAPRVVHDSPAEGHRFGCVVPSVVEAGERYNIRCKTHPFGVDVTMGGGEPEVGEST